MKSLAHRFVYASIAATLLSVPIGFVNEQSYHAHAASYIDQCNLVESENNSEGVDLVLYSDICDGTVYATATLSNNLGGSVPDTIHLRDDTVGVQVDSKSGDLKNGTITTDHVIESCTHTYSAHDDASGEPVSAAIGCGK